MAKEMKKAFNENAIIKQISMVGIIGNIILCAFKMFAGIVGKSGAMEAQRACGSQ